jgi:hypothetical protein
VNTLESARISIAVNAATTTRSDATLQLLLSDNLVTDPILENGLISYERTVAGNDWGVYDGGLFGSHFVIGSHSYHEFSQVVDLTETLSDEVLDAHSVPLTLGAWCIRGSWADDRIVIKAEFRDGTGAVLRTDTYHDALVNSETWTFRGSKVSDHPVGTRQVRIIMGNNDGEGWAGQYGAAFDGITVAAGEREMRFSSDLETWSDWEPAATTKAWSLGTGLGVRKVYVQMRDPANPGELQTSFDTIEVLAPSPPPV